MADFDVIVVGAGLSGVGAACRLQAECPGMTFAVLEARDRVGGTWDLFRYPGVRSDSDMFTLSYPFRPWSSSQAIAGGPDIRAYIAETARQHGIDRRIRFGHRVEAASWSSADARWSLDVADSATGARREMSCSFLHLCAGYYRYDRGYQPAFPGQEGFGGLIVHPQHWPEDLDHAGRRVVVVGSGATAVTLVPAMAATARHVTMLQRSPSYILSVPATDPLARRLDGVVPPAAAYRLVRWKNAALTALFYQLSRRRPETVKRMLRAGAAAHLPAGYDVDVHFRPSYDPWDQRMCLAPDADLFTAVRRGRASMVTGEIDTFTETGIRLSSGAELEADIVVTATGLRLQAMGGIALAVDGAPVRLPETVTYRGMMLCGVPNLAFTMGYTNASWTLRADLVAGYVCRLLNHMAATGRRYCVPRPPAAGEPTRDFIDLTSGYVRRSIADLPRQGSRSPWVLNQNWFKDLWLFRHTPVGVQMDFFPAGGPSRRSTGAPPATAA